MIGVYGIPSFWTTPNSLVNRTSLVHTRSQYAARRSADEIGDFPSQISGTLRISPLNCWSHWDFHDDFRLRCRWWRRAIGIHRFYPIAPEDGPPISIGTSFKVFERHKFWPWDESGYTFQRTHTVLVETTNSKTLNCRAKNAPRLLQWLRKLMFEKSGYWTMWFHRAQHLTSAQATLQATREQLGVIFRELTSPWWLSSGQPSLRRMVILRGFYIPMMFGFPLDGWPTSHIPHLPRFWPWLTWALQIWPNLFILGCDTSQFCWE